MSGEGASRTKRWTLAILGATLLVAACGRGGGQSAPPATIAAAPPETSASPPTPLARTPEAPASPYAALKIAAVEFANAERPLEVTRFEGDAPYFDLVDCNEDDRATDPKGRASSRLETIARRVALLKVSLAKAGYPAQLFQPALDGYEAREIGLAAEKPQVDKNSYEVGLLRLAADVDRARQAERPDLPAVRLEGGCGGGETPIVVRSDPRGARVWLITKFAFNVCKARGRDPWNAADCDRWSEMDPDHAAELSGVYAYQARWPDGSTARGDKRLQGDPDQTLVFKVRKN